jgi:uncharacterized repeat protein (TIGR01451 family)
VYNNTIMKNLTTATAITSNGQPAPAGLSTSLNSNLLKTFVPAAGNFSNPVVFNNIFWDNRAGTRTLNSVIGLSNADANHWDLGVADGTATDLVALRNSIVQQVGGYADGGNNLRPAAGPQVVSTYDVGVTFNSWRNNPAFLGAILISADLPPNQMGDYHLANGSPAIDAGAASWTIGSATYSAPGFDYDNQLRPAGNGFDIGADEKGATAGGGTTPPPVTNGRTANLGVQINPLSVVGNFIRYSVVATNAGPDTVNSVLLTSAMPSGASSMSWGCSPRANCPARNGVRGINASLNLAKDQSATFTVTVQMPSSTGTVKASANVSAAGITDPNVGNNSKTDVVVR